MKEQWKQDIQQKLADFQQPAPELSWDIIEEAVRQKRTAKKLHLVALWTVVTTAAAIALLLVGHFSLSVHQQQAAQTPLLAQPSATAPNTVQHEYSYPSAENNTPQSASSTTESIKQVFRHLAQAFSNVKDSDYTATPILTAALTSDPPNTNCETPKEGHKPLPASTLEHQTTTSTFTKSHSYRPAPSTELTAKVYVSGLLGASNSNSPSATLAVSGTYYDCESTSDTRLNSIPTWEEASGMDRDVHHHQPIRIGFSLRYTLSKRWSIEGGFSYSHHSTDITETSDNFKSYTDQQLTYIGIPVNANYSVWSTQRWNIYASAGGEIERMVKGKATTHTVVDGVTNPETEETIKMSRPLFSVNAAMGAELKLTEGISIYTEPGLGYHFRNGEKLSTIYRDNPLNLHLNLGLRFQLK